MPKKAELHIVEGEGEILKLIAQHPEERKRKRLRALLHIKRDTFPTRQALANHMEINKRTLERWVNDYKRDGLPYLVREATRNKPSKMLPPEILADLEKRLKSPHNCFKSYKEVLQYLRKAYPDRHFTYSNIRSILIKKLGTKLKVGRKSHIKKDPKAKAAFLKNAIATA